MFKKFLTFVSVIIIFAPQLQSYPGNRQLPNQGDLPLLIATFALLSAQTQQRHPSRRNNKLKTQYPQQKKLGRHQGKTQSHYYH